MKKLILACLFTSSAFAGSLSLKETTLNFTSNRNVTVTNVTVAIECARSATFFERFNNGMRDDESCRSFAINGVKKELGTFAKFKLANVGTNQFLLENLKLTFDDYRSGTVCITISAEMDGVPDYRENRYVNRYDNFSLLSYCTANEIPSFFINKATYENRRVKSLEAYKKALKSPINIQLK